MITCCVQVKRKDPPEATSAGDNKRARPSTPVDDELEDEGNYQHGKSNSLRRGNVYTLRSLFSSCQWLIGLVVYFCQTGTETQLSSLRTIPKWTPMGL